MLPMVHFINETYDLLYVHQWQFLMYIYAGQEAGCKSSAFCLYNKTSASTSTIGSKLTFDGTCQFGDQVIQDRFSCQSQNWSFEHMASLTKTQLHLVSKHSVCFHQCYHLLISEVLNTLHQCCIGRLHGIYRAKALHVNAEFEIFYTEKWKT